MFRKKKKISFQKKITVRVGTDVSIQRYFNNIVNHTQWRREQISSPKSNITKLPPDIFHIYLGLKKYKRHSPRSATISFARHS